MLKKCQQCGVEFVTGNGRRLFCSDRCRREADNERKRERRAEERAERDGWRDAEFGDPWERNDAALAGSLIDGWTDAGAVLPCGIQYCADEVIGGPLACQQCNVLREQTSPCEDCGWRSLELKTEERRNYGPARWRRFDPALVCFFCD